MSLEHTLRAIAMCWPLSFNFWTILSVNGVISDIIPKDLTQKRHGEEQTSVFSAEQRCVFAQEFARLDLVIIIEAPGFGGGVELTSGRQSEPARHPPWLCWVGASSRPS